MSILNSWYPLGISVMELGYTYLLVMMEYMYRGRSGGISCKRLHKICKGKNLAFVAFLCISLCLLYPMFTNLDMMDRLDMLSVIGYREGMLDGALLCRKGIEKGEL